MSRLFLEFTLLILPALCLVQEPDTDWPPAGDTIPLYDDLGNDTFPISCAGPGVQRYVDQGFRFVEAFDFSRAVLSFRAARRLDPACAMCVWGEALALGPSLNSFDEPRLLATVPLAHSRALEAQRLAAQGTLSARENALVRALSTRYAPTTREYLLREHELTEQYARAMAAVLAAHGPEPALAALTAAAWMNTHPWDYWEKPGTPRAEGREALGVLRAALASYPHHALCVHLFVHITEASGDAALLEEARPLAELLPRLLPGAPHLVHMAFHTLMHVGGYGASDSDNARASSLPRQIYPLHNLDTLAWVCRMEGRQGCALSAARRLRDLALPGMEEGGIFETGFPLARFASQHMLTLVAFDLADEILALEPLAGCRESFSCGIWHFARGAARAARGDAAGAREELRALEVQTGSVAVKMSRRPEWAWRNFNGTRDFGVYPADAILRLASLELAARAARAEGDVAAEADAWRAAGDAELALPYDEPPAWYLPTGPCFGDALWRGQQPRAAAAAYEAALAQLPRSGRALFGLLQLCEEASPAGGCEGARARFQQAWRRADAGLRSACQAGATSELAGVWGPVGRGPAAFVAGAAAAGCLALCAALAGAARLLRRRGAAPCRACACLGPDYRSMPEGEASPPPAAGGPASCQPW